MRVHLVGGFLGSGKTTAISNGCAVLADKGIKNGVVTNDQGNYLVDSRFMALNNIPSAEVKGGCFCCNYDQLNGQINELKEKYNPEVIFAETVGSCTDLVATVLKPLIKYRKNDIEKVTFSSFVDSGILLAYLKGKGLPFGYETNYIWEKQIEEAEILIVNKVDLLGREELDELKNLAGLKYMGKIMLFQNSLDAISVNEWIENLDKITKEEHKSIEVDYNIYGAGEANLAWLDEEIEFISANGSAARSAYQFINLFSGEILKRNLPVGHLKFFAGYNKKSEKISATASTFKSIDMPAEIEDSDSATILLNARIQVNPDELRQMVMDIIAEMKKEGMEINEYNVAYFQPSFPNPTHRIEN